MQQSTNNENHSKTKFLARIEKFWGLIKSPSFMAVVAIGGTVFAIYTTYFLEKRAELLFSVDALSKVFDVHKPIGGLEVSYSGENLREAKKTLWYLSLKVQNSGNAGVKKVDYDDLSPVGVRILGATISEIQPIKASNGYLQKNLSARRQTNEIYFSLVIFEPNDAFEISMLLLSSEGQKPEIETLGVLSGAPPFRIQVQDVSSKSKSFWGYFLEGTIGVHLFRFGIYGLVFLGCVVGLTLLAASFFDRRAAEKDEWGRQHRRDLISKYKYDDNLLKEMSYLINAYNQDGLKKIYQIEGYLNTSKRREILAGHLHSLDPSKAEIVINQLIPIEGLSANIGSELRDQGIVTDGPTPELYDAYMKLYRYLELHLPMQSKPDFAGYIAAAAKQE